MTNKHNENKESHSLNRLLSHINQLQVKLNDLRDIDQTSIKKALDIEYTYDSNRIEGNTLSLRETDLVIHKGLTIGGKPLVEHLEAINHYEAVGSIRDMAKQDALFNRSVLLTLHALVLRGIDKDYAGRFREFAVIISGSRHTPPQPWLVNGLMDEYFQFYQENKQTLHPVILAAEMHERLVTIHPFADGNGRTARLIMNLILLKYGYSIVIIQGNTESRLSYYNALERCNLENDKNEFHLLIANHTLNALQTRLALIKNPPN
jgi:Fic family protein